MSEVVDHIIVGAGISGLGMAHHSLERGVRTLVLEGADRVGGCLNSQSFSDCGDFWVEAGSHTCFNSYAHLLDILSDLGVRERLVPKVKLRYRLWRGGKRSSIFSALRPWQLAISLPRLFSASKANRAVAEYYRAGLGRDNYRELFRPAFRAVICQDPDEFPADLLFRRKPRRKDIVRSFTLPGGLSDIPRAIAAQKSLEIRTAQRVQGIGLDGDGYLVRTATGQTIRGRYLTLAVPPDATAALLPAGMGELRGLVRGIEMSRIETLVLAVPAAELRRLPPLAGLIGTDADFFSMVARDYMPDRDYRGFGFHFRHGALDAQAQVAYACQALGITAEQIAAVTRVDNRLPALRAGHTHLVRRIDGVLAGSRLAITGNWFLGVSIEDCLTRSHQEDQRLFAP